MNGDALVDAVGALVNIAAPDLDSDPSSTDILTWLNMAQDMIVRNVPAEDVQRLWDTAVVKDIAGCVRVISVTVDGTPCRWVKLPELEQLSAAVTADEDKAVWSYCTGITPPNISIKTVPTGTTPSVVYVAEPVYLTDEGSRDVATVPVIYDQILILYAVAMAKIKDEEMPDAQYLLQVVGSLLGRAGLPDEAITARR